MACGCTIFVWFGRQKQENESCRHKTWKESPGPANPVFSCSDMCHIENLGDCTKNFFACVGLDDPEDHARILAEDFEFHRRFRGEHEDRHASENLCVTYLHAHGNTVEGGHIQIR